MEKQGATANKNIASKINAKEKCGEKKTKKQLTLETEFVSVSRRKSISKQRIAFRLKEQLPECTVKSVEPVKENKIDDR